MAERIEDEVVRAGWPVGELIGREPELLERFGVSRAVFREAVRIVEHHGVARMRRGGGGGLVVTEPDLSSISRAAALRLDHQRVTGEHLAHARLVAERATVIAATPRLDAIGRERLEAAVAADAHAAEHATTLADIPSRGVHATIAEVSANPALQLFVDVLLALTATDHGVAQLSAKLTTTEQIRAMAAEIHTAHAAIVQAMVTGDADLAAERMRKHLVAMERWLT